MNKQLLILRAMSDFGWTKAFATEYVMQRTYNGLSHNSAFNKAMKSTWVRDHEKPRR